MAATDNVSSTRRLFVTDFDTKKQYLIDSGADLSVFPRKFMRGPLKRTSFDLTAANGSIIGTYGSSAINLNFGLRKSFSWKFVIADVAKPIIGADFIAHFGLLIDLKHKRLIDSETGLTTKGKVMVSNLPSIKIISNDNLSPFLELLKQYPEISRPNGRNQTTKHHIKHFIRTTAGQPVTCKPRRLAPEKLIIAKR